MIVLGRHRPLTHDAWSELAVRAVIEEIAADAISHFDPEGFWPGHPSDDGAVDGNPSFYWGAAGVIWALDYLHRIGATRVAKDFRPHRALLIWCIGAQKQILSSRSGSSCGACPGRWWPQSTWPR